MMEQSETITNITPPATELSNFFPSPNLPPAENSTMPEVEFPAEVQAATEQLLGLVRHNSQEGRNWSPSQQQDRATLVDMAIRWASLYQQINSGEKRGIGFNHLNPPTEGSSPTTTRLGQEITAMRGRVRDELLKQIIQFGSDFPHTNDAIDTSLPILAGVVDQGISMQQVQECFASARKTTLDTRLI